MKSKLKGAQTGHDLLKRKSEALTKCVSTATFTVFVVPRLSTPSILCIL